jgi:KaiC/GvpD/RAD55 family RecA-like ATPase
VGIIKDIGIEYHDNPLERLKKIKSEMGTLRTGFDVLDQKLENVGPGQLMIALALSGGGKSIFMQNVALNMIEQKKNVVYISLELGEEQIGLRVDAMNLQWPTRKILDNIEEASEKIISSKSRHGSFQMVKFPSGINISVIRNYLKEYQIRTGIRPEILFVDYMDLMTPSQKRVDPANLSLRDKLISEELRNLAFENNLLVITAAQFNRSGYSATNAETNSVPGTGNVAGGITKVYTADVVISVLLTGEMREAGRGLFVLEKTRNSKYLGAKIPFSYDIDTMRMGTIDEGDFQLPHTRKLAQANDTQSQKKTSAKANIDKIAKFTTL